MAAEPQMLRGQRDDGAEVCKIKGALATLPAPEIVPKAQVAEDLA